MAHKVFKAASGVTIYSDGSITGGTYQDAVKALQRDLNSPDWFDRLCAQRILDLIFKD